jgi:hypothetical protein
MPFAMAVVGRDSKDHSSDCFFCLTYYSGIMSKPKHMVIYPNLPLATSSVLHNEELLEPKPSNNVTLDEDDSYNDEVNPDKLGEGTDSDTAFEQNILKTLLHNSSRS